MDPIFHMISGAPDPVAPFSHAVEADGWVFVTGQMPFASTSTDAPYPEGIEAQTRQVMKNLENVLAGCGLGLGNVLSVRIFLTHFEADYDAMNAVYASYFARKAPGTHLCGRYRTGKGRAGRDRHGRAALNRERPTGDQPITRPAAATCRP